MREMKTEVVDEATTRGYAVSPARARSAPVAPVPLVVEPPIQRLPGLSSTRRVNV